MFIVCSLAGDGEEEQEEDEDEGETEIIIRVVKQRLLTNS